MKFKMFSVIVGSPACIANCPFCVSGETPNNDNMKSCEINWRNSYKQRRTTFIS